jgi:hypothetical protein
VAFFDILGLDLGVLAWILALAGGLVGAVLFWRFLDWALIIFASLLGSMLIVRGALSLFPSLTGALGTLIVVVLTAAGIFYHYRKNAPKTTATAS